MNTYKDILINGVANVELLNDTKPEEIKEYVTNFIKYDEYSYELIHKILKEYKKKYDVQFYIYKEEECFYFYADKKTYDKLLTYSEFTSLRPIVQSLECSLENVENINDVKVNQIVTNNATLMDEIKTTYDCSNSIAQQLKTNNRIVKMFWSDKYDHVVFVSCLPLQVHNTIVKTFFTEHNIKFLPNNYNKKNKNPLIKSEFKNETIVDEEGFITKVKKPYVKKN